MDRMRTGAVLMENEKSREEWFQKLSRAGNFD